MYKCCLVLILIAISWDSLSQSALKISQLKLPIKKSSSSASASDAISRVYAQKRDSFYAQAQALTESANNTYVAAIQALGVPTPANQIATFNAQFDVLQANRNNTLAEAQQYKKEGQMFDYYCRTVGWVNYFLQHHGFVTNATDAQLFYDNDTSNHNAKFLNNTLLNIGTNASTVSLYNEVFADYLGCIRLGVGVLLNNNQPSSGTASTDTAQIQQTAIQTLIGGGANGTINVSYPLLSVVTLNNTFYIKLLVNPQVGANVPKIGTSTNSPTYNWDLMGLGGGVYYTGATGVISLFSTFKFSYIGGSTDFYTALNKSDDKAFMFDQVSLGIAISSVFRASWNIYYGSPFVKSNFPHSFSISVMPN
jgi:hypothetical protein